MSLENTNLQGGISLATGFFYQATAPLDKRFTVKNIDGLAELVGGNAAYNGLQVYVESTHETYRLVNGTWEKVLEENDINALVNAKVAEANTAAMEFMGTVAYNLPLLDASDKGHFYKIINHIPLENDHLAITPIQQNISWGYGEANIVKEIHIPNFNYPNLS